MSPSRRCAASACCFFLRLISHGWPVTIQSSASPHQSRQFAVPFFDLLASAGRGAQIDLASKTAQDPDDQWVFPRQWLAKLGRCQTAALRIISISSDSMVSLLEHDDTVMLDCSQTHPLPPGIFLFLMIVLALLPSALKPFLAPHRKCSVFPRQIQPIAVTIGVLMRYISSGVWYGLRAACNEAFLIKLF